MSDRMAAQRAKEIEPAQEPKRDMNALWNMVGKTVRVVSADTKTYLGIGEIVGYIALAMNGHTDPKLVTPLIVLDATGETILGSDCWWEPVEGAQ